MDDKDKIWTSLYTSEEGSLYVSLETFFSLPTVQDLIKKAIETNSQLKDKKDE